MIHYVNEFMNSIINNMTSSLSFLFILLFYTLVVIQMPVDNIVHLFGFVLLVATGLNLVLYSDKAAEVKR